MISTNKPNLENIKLIDSHVHFWNIDNLQYPWLNNVQPLNKSFELEDFHKETNHLPIEKIIFVQAECLPKFYLKEIDYVEELAQKDPRIVAIIPYFPLDDDKALSLLHTLTQNSKIKGIRRLEEEPNSLYQNEAFIHNFPLLSDFNLSFDLGVTANQLDAALSLVDKFPSQKFILDHFGKPAIKTKDINRWKSQITSLSANPNVYCKLSGLITESDLTNWQTDDLQPYVDHVLEQFGSKRVLYGSDWPVVTLGANYKDWLSCAFSLCKGLDHTDLHNIFYQNALDFYQLES